MLFVILMSPVPLKIDFTSLHFHPSRCQQYKAEYERRACKTESCPSLSCSIEHPLFSAKPTISQHGWLCWTGGPMLFQGFIAQRGWSAVRRWQQHWVASSWGQANLSRSNTTSISSGQRGWFGRLPSEASRTMPMLFWDLFDLLCVFGERHGGPDYGKLQAECV